MKDIKVRHETLKLLEENIGTTLEDIGIDNFLNRTSTARKIRARIDYFKLESFCTENNYQSEKTADRMRKNVSSYQSHSGLIFRI
jgi:hypothetical protein